LKVAVESVLDIAARGLDAAMNVRNTRPKQAKPKPKKQGEGDGPTTGSEGEAKAPPAGDKLGGSA
jgi:PTH1 family peptidyl-tRNA hydrolase